VLKLSARYSLGLFFALALTVVIVAQQQAPSTSSTTDSRVWGQKTSGTYIPVPVDDLGKLVVLPYASPQDLVSGAITVAMTGTTSTSLIQAPPASQRNYVTACTVSNSHATVGTDVVLQDGNGGTTFWTFPAGINYGGTAQAFPAPLRQPTAATALFAADVTSGASVKISCSGFKAP
jgi:hypothetical protein